mmetsp:Transcript_4911/g.10198  ORF Transcript_4911/g.10198 Transcript_4911/m.10198 type:complete len:247 (-) Transcript_4911:144-884(-)
MSPAWMVDSARRLVNFRFSMVECCRNHRRRFPLLLLGTFKIVPRVLSWHCSTNVASLFGVSLTLVVNAAVFSPLGRLSSRASSGIAGGLTGHFKCNSRADFVSKDSLQIGHTRLVVSSSSLVLSSVDFSKTKCIDSDTLASLTDPLKRTPSVRRCRYPYRAKKCLPNFPLRYLRGAANFDSTLAGSGNFVSEASLHTTCAKGFESTSFWTSLRFWKLAASSRFHVVGCVPVRHTWTFFEICFAECR